MTPFFQIIQGEIDVTSRAGGGNVSLSITDGVGQTSDTIDYRISDEDGVIATPRTGVEVQVIGGYRERAARDFGRFTIDEVTHEGFPLVIGVNGQSVGAKTAAKQRRSESFKRKDTPTYGALIEKLAQRNGLLAAVDPEVKFLALEYEAQTEEDDLAFLTRVGSVAGFDLTVKNSHLLATRRGVGRTTNGLALPLIEIGYGINLLDFTSSKRDRPRYGRVIATYFDREAAETRKVDAASSAEGPDFLLRSPFRSEETARQAARAKAADLRRGTATAEFRIVGNEQARAEAFVEVTGIRNGVDVRWRAITVSHEFSAVGGYTTTVQCELPGDEGTE